MYEDEIWRTIEGYEGLYEVSNLGRVRSLDKTHIVKKGNSQWTQLIPGRIMRFWEATGKFNYYLVGLSKNNIRKDFLVHRLVAQTFIPNPNNYPVVNHIDCDCHNNRVENLEWCTQSYNIHWGYVCGNRQATIQKLRDKNGVRIYCPELDKVFESKLAASRELNMSDGCIEMSINRKGRKTRSYRKYTIIRLEDKEDYFKYIEEENSIERAIFSKHRHALDLKTGQIFTRPNEVLLAYNIPQGTKSTEFFNQFHGMLPKYGCYLADIGYQITNPYSEDQRMDRIKQLKLEFVRKVGKTVIRCDTTGQLYRTAQEADDLLGLANGCITQCLYYSSGSYASQNLHFSRIPVIELTDEECLQFADGFIKSFAARTSFKYKRDITT